jgi:hypothetical protein
MDKIQQETHTSSADKYIYPPIDVNYDISYNDNFGYRKTMRELFFMKNPDLSEYEDLDEETRDELLFDEKAISKVTDEIYELTKTHTLFIELYTLAAGCFISTDAEIGLAVLLCYDYLPLFHKCLGSFFRNEFDRENIYYKELKRKLS